MLSVRRVFAFLLLVVFTTAGLTGIAPGAARADGGSGPPGAAEADGLPSQGAELPGLRTATSKTYETSEPGRLRLVSSPAPIHYQDADGAWQDIDSAWSAATAPGVALRNGANAFTATLAPLANAASLATLAIDAGHSAGFGMAGALPAPVHVGSDAAKATYAGVLPGVDLELTLKPDGVKEDIVLHGPAATAPDTFVFPLALQGLTAAIDDDGDVVYTDETGEVRAHTPRGVLVDAAGVTATGGAGVSGAVRYELIPLGAATALRVTADRAWLNDPARVWPVRVDPRLTLGPDRMETYRNGCTAFYADGDVRVGNAMACGNSHWRTAAHFDYDQLYGKTLNAASLHLTNLTGGATLNGYTTYVSQATQWGWSCKGSDGSSSAAGETEQHFYNGRILEIYRTAIAARAGNYTLCLVGTETSGLYTYKHFATIQLWLDYEDPNRAPYTPDSRSPASGTKATSVTLSARYLDPDASDNGSLQFEIQGVTTVNKSATDGATATYTPSLGQGTYSWRVRAFDGALYSAWTSYWTFSIVKPPSAPGNVTAKGGVRSATVTWSLSTNDGGSPIDSYIVDAHNADGTFTGIRNVECETCTSSTVRGLLDDRSYFFRVYAHNAVAGNGAYGQSPVVRTAAVPGQPTNVIATADYAAAEITWSAPSDGGSSITSYTVGGDNVTIGQPLVPVDCTTCVSTRTFRYENLVPGNQYKFRVRATNAVGTGMDSLDSNTVTVEPTVTVAPTNVRAVPGDQEATVAWDPPTAAVDGRTTYTVNAYQDNETGPDPYMHSTDAGTATTVVVKSLKNGVPVYFRVTSTNAVVTSPESEPSNTVVPAGKPFPPTGVTATPGDKKATVTWDAVDDNGARITNFTVTAYRASDNSAAGTTDGAAKPITVEGLANGTAYYFKVRATNAKGTGDDSAASNTVVPAGRPFPPTTVTAVKGDTTATVSWSGANGNGRTITNYIVTASPGGATRVTDGATTAAFTGLTNGVSYSFTVVARTEIGDSDPSAPSNPVVPSGKPGVPANVVAIDGDGTDIEVSWTAAEPNGAAITKYLVEAYPENTAYPMLRRETHGRNTKMRFNSSEDGVFYSFRVRAYNSNGPGEWSALSNTAVRRSPPTPPPNVSVTEPANGSATVRWDAANPRGAAITNYRVYAYSASGGPTQSVTVGDVRQASISNLTAGPYVVAVTAINPVGEGEPSKMVGTDGMPVPKLVGLGDSYSSGEGNPVFELGTEDSGNGCHRSEKKAYPKLFRSGLPMDLTFPACSGAVIDDVQFRQQKTKTNPETQGGQISRVPTNANVLTMTIGGNDSGFSDVIISCTLKPGCHMTDQARDTERKIEEQRGRLATLYQRLRTAAPTADIVVLTYPRIFAESVNELCMDDIGIDPDERKWLIGRTYQLRDVITQVGAANGVRVIDVVEAFNGHEICKDDPWVYGARKDLGELPPGKEPPDEDEEAEDDTTIYSYHPKAEGHAELARRIKQSTVLRHPTVTSVTPGTAIAAGSACASYGQVVVRGTNFAPGAEVFFGPDKVSASYVSPTELRVTPPVRAEGRVDVRVRTNRGVLWGMSPPSAGSAFEYVRDTTPPTTTATISPAPNSAGWHRGDVTVSLKATDPTCPMDVKSVSYRASGSEGGENIPTTTTAGSTATASVRAEGVTTVTFWATDSSGNVESSKQVVVRIDRTGPTTVVDGAAEQVVTQGTTLAGGATDNLSGVKSTTVRFEDPLGVNPPVVRQAACTGGCGTRSARWSVSTEGLRGAYTVRAWSFDVADNQGPESAPVTVVVL